MDNNQRPFVWTDELVLAFARYTNLESPTFQGRYTDLEEFKASHSIKEEEVGWEVISLEYKGSISFWSSGRGYTLQEVQKDGYSIYSVRRLSDGEVFTVGDYVSWKGVCNQSAVIKDFSFSKKENVELLCINDVYVSDAASLQKAPKKQPLLITSDGVSLFNPEDEYWRVYDDYSSGKFKISDGQTYEVLKTFSTKEAADEYVLNNRPCLSYKDVMDIVHSVNDGAKGYDTKNYLSHQFKQLIKERLKIN